MRKNSYLRDRTFVLLENLRENGWLVVLKALPHEVGWLLQGSRSEYDAPCPDKLIGHGKWCCEAKWMRQGAWRHDYTAMADEPDKAIQTVWMEIHQNELKAQRQGRRA